MKENISSFCKKLIKFVEITGENIKEHNPNQPQISDHSYRILIFGGSGSGKTNALLYLRSDQTDIDEIYLYTKDLYEPKYQLLINRC